MTWLFGIFGNAKNILMASDTGTAPKDIFSLKNKLNISDLTLVTKKLPNKMSIYKDSNKYFLIQNKEYKVT